MADVLKQDRRQVSSAGGEIVLQGASSKTYTVLSVSMCNIHASNDETFSLSITDADGSSNEFFIYHTQSLPAQSTFIHNDKIVVEATEELRVRSPSGSATIDVVVSYLEQDV